MADCSGDIVTDEQGNDMQLQVKQTPGDALLNGGPISRSLALTYESILKELGGFGRYQLRVFIMVSLFEMPAAWAMLLPMLTHATPQWICRHLNESSFTTNIKTGTNNSYVATDDRNITLTMCKSNKAVCDNLNFPGNDFTSIVSEWHLVCGEKTIPGFIMSIQMGGVLIGALIAGQLADVYGRRRVLFAAYLLLLIVWLISAFSVSWPMYGALRFIIGALIGGVMVVNFVLPMEFVLPKWRTFCGCIGFWAVGFMTLGLWGYLVRDWRHLTIATSTSGFLLLTLWRWIPESPRWLYYNGRVKAAAAVLNQIAIVNGRPMPDITSLTNYFEAEKSERLRQRQLFSYWHLCSSVRLALHSLTLLYLWFVSSSVYYGMSLNVMNISGDRYLNIFFYGMVEIPALIYLLIVNNRLGRRKTLFSLMITASAFCFGILLLDSLGMIKSHPIPATVLSMVGKSAIAGGWAAVQIVSAETFPTVIRNIGIASCSMAARVGGIIAPQLVLLVKFGTAIPFTVFGTLAVIAAILGCFLPEKKNIPLPDMLADAGSGGAGIGRVESGQSGQSADDLEMDEIPPNTLIIHAT